MSMTEIIIIAVVALILIGPKELPNVARTLGKTLRDVRRAGDDLRDTIEREVMEEPKPPTAPPSEAIASGSPFARVSSAHAAPQQLPEESPAAAPAPVEDAAPSAQPQESKGAA